MAQPADAQPASAASFSARAYRFERALLDANDSTPRHIHPAARDERIVATALDAAGLGRASTGAAVATLAAVRERDYAGRGAYARAAVRDHDYAEQERTA